ncbi:MAG: Zn-ribbon domain-containing OB-fold protein [Planctomycetota bacterium]
MNTELRGTSLREDDIRTGKALITEWRPKIDYKFDAGVAVGQFLDGLKAGKLMGRKCNACERVVIPPRMFCELCFRRNDAWIELQDTGRVNTFSVSFVNWDASRRKTPQVPAVIDIDGTNPAMGILHLMGEVGETLDDVLEHVKIGMQVEAVWKPAEQREGAITDILYFRPSGRR